MTCPRPNCPHADVEHEHLVRLKQSGALVFDAAAPVDDPRLAKWREENPKPERGNLTDAEHEAALDKWTSELHGARELLDVERSAPGPAAPAPSGNGLLDSPRLRELEERVRRLETRLAKLKEADIAMLILRDERDSARLAADVAASNRQAAERERDEMRGALEEIAEEPDEAYNCEWCQRIISEVGQGDHSDDCPRVVARTALAAISSKAGS